VTPLQWERLEDLADRTAAFILAADACAAQAAEDARKNLADITAG
jgi:hypothetical protein